MCWCHEFILRRYWNTVPREQVRAPSLSEFKEHLEDAFSHMV